MKKVQIATSSITYVTNIWFNLLLLTISVDPIYLLIRFAFFYFSMQKFNFYFEICEVIVGTINYFQKYV